MEIIDYRQIQIKVMFKMIRLSKVCLDLKFSNKVYNTIINNFIMRDDVK